nr:hypothetical protein [Tanacetum cinerariifolium]
AQEVEILRLKDRVQVLEDRESVAAKQAGDDALIKWRSINEGEVAAERISNDSKEIARVLTSMDAAIVIAGGIDVPTGSSSIPTAGPPATDISTGSEVAPTAKQQEKEDIRMNEQIVIDAEVARIHAEEELQELPLEKRIELINDLVKYQKNYSKVYKFQSQQRRPMTKKQKRDYYMAMIRNNLGWKEEAERLKRKGKGLNLEQEHVKKQKTSEEDPEIEKSTEEIFEEKIKEMMQLVPVEDVYVQAIQVKHPIID